MSLLEKYEERLKQLENGAKEFYKGETENILTILKLG